MRRSGETACTRPSRGRYHTVGLIELTENLDLLTPICEERAFIDFRREHEAEIQRLRERYASAEAS